MSAAPRTDRSLSILNQWPTALLIVGWAGSLFFLWLGCYQAWKEKNDAIIVLKNEHPTTIIGEIHKELVDKKNPDRYTNIDIDVSAKGVIGAVPQLVSICKIRNNHCDSDFTLNYNRQIGWRKVSSSELRIDINGTEQMVPIIIQNGRAFVYFVGKNGTKEPDPGCKWCDNMPVGEYHFQVQIQSNNSFEIGYYVFDWLGKVERSNVVKTRSGYEYNNHRGSY